MTERNGMALNMPQLFLSMGNILIGHRSDARSLHRKIIIHTEVVKTFIPAKLRLDRKKK